MKRIIETPRLIIREYVREDFDALYEILSDSETMKHYPAPLNREQTTAWIERNIKRYEILGFGLWAVILKETGEVIGDCGLTLQIIDGEELPEIGYHINKKYQRQGLGTEAARAVRDWAFLNTKFSEIYSYMKYTNEASYKTAMANGMKKVKEYEDPRNKISYAYSITRDEWMDIYFDMTPAKEDEKEEILKLYDMQKGKEFCPWDDHYPSMNEINMDIELDSLFVVRREGRIIAAISIDHDEAVDILPQWTIKPAGEISRVAVHPEFQNKGIARFMIRHIMKVLKTRNYKGIHYLVNKHNVKAIKSYEKLNFNLVGECELFNQPFWCYEKEV